MAYVGKRSRCGTLTTTPLDGGPATTQQLLCCVHCGYVWTPTPGSGKKRGWCGNCAGYICGHADCVAAGCVPLEAAIENIEAGRPETFRRIIVPIDCAPPA